MAFLGVNIDHVATVRNARGGSIPDPVQAALIAESNGADGITAHLREDRRHIRDADMHALQAKIATRLNMEMANTPEMVQIALGLKPYMVTLVPERREEITTEGGLDVVSHLEAIKASVGQLQAAGIKASLFIDPEDSQVEASKASGAQCVELHTGQYCETYNTPKCPEALQALMRSAVLCQKLGLELNAGHGLNYENVAPILALPGLIELNIGHSIVSEAIFTGLGAAVSRMKNLIR